MGSGHTSKNDQKMIKNLCTVQERSFCTVYKLTDHIPECKMTDEIAEDLVLLAAINLINELLCNCMQII